MEKQRTVEESSPEKNISVKKMKIMTKYFAMNLKALMEIFIRESTKQ